MKLFLGYNLDFEVQKFFEILNEEIIFIIIIFIKNLRNRTNYILNLQLLFKKFRALINGYIKTQLKKNFNYNCYQIGDLAQQKV